jgi:quercetin dioxygenase-like cupin family protein
MTYLGEGGETTAVVIHLQDQLSRPGVGRAVAVGAQTHGDFGLFRGELAAGTEIAAHFHRAFSESFYILSGEIELWNGAVWSAASSGELVHVPRGGVHGFRVPEGAAADVLMLFTPGIPREQFFLELLEIRQSGRTPTSDEWTEFYRRHDQYMV